jgi:hypothetical protein
MVLGRRGSFFGRRNLGVKAVCYLRGLFVFERWALPMARCCLRLCFRGLSEALRC